MDYAVGILMKKKPAVSNLFSFLNPFHVTVWYSIIAGLVVVSLLLYVLNRVSPKRIRGPKYHDTSLHGIFWFVYSSLVQQSTDMYLVTMSSQIVIGVWWFFILIIVSSYTANLAAFLTVTQMEKPIQSFQVIKYIMLRIYYSLTPKPWKCKHKKYIRPKLRFCSNIAILVKKRNFGQIQIIDILVKHRIFV